MKNRLLILPVFIVLALFTTVSYADDDDRVLTFNVSVLNIPLQSAKRATLHAINFKNWKINTVTQKEIYFQYDDVKAMADFKNYPEIKLIYTGEDTGSSRWFPAIKKNALVEMVYCM